MIASSAHPRILLLNQFFWPDGAPTGLLLADVAKTLVERGCDVTVVCGRSSYAEGRQGDPPPVKILYMPTMPYDRTSAGRLLSWVSFLGWAGMRCTFSRRFDLIVSLTSPPGLSVIGAVLKKLRGTEFWIWEMDVYPDVAIALGALKAGSLAGRLMRGVMDGLRRQADGIITLGPCMRDLFLNHGLDPAKLHVAENWADGELIRPANLPLCPPLIVGYSGNLGLAHETDTITQVMLRLKKRPDFRFVFGGGGARLAQLKQFCETNQVGNTVFRPYLERGLLRDGLAACHLGLVTLRPECAGTVVPSKVYSLLAAGRPFLYIGPPEATPGRIAAEGCGWQFAPGDVDGVTALLERLLANPALVREAGAQARRVFTERYDRRHGTGRIADLLVV